MTAPRDPDRLIHTFLTEGEDELLDQVYDAVRAGIEQKRQRAVIGPWRAPTMNKLVAFGLGAAAVVAAVLIGSRFIGLSNIGGPIPSLPPSPSPGQAVDFPDLTQTFVSPRNGYSVNYPDGAVVTAAWHLQESGADPDFDVVETGLSAVFEGELTDVPGGSSWFGESFWDDAYLASVECDASPPEQPETTIDGQPAWILECPNGIEAAVSAGVSPAGFPRFYLFKLLHDRSDGRAVFDAFAATIDLTPETAITFPAMPDTFVSPTYGYSFDYLDRGGLEPATEVWDPDNEPFDMSVNLDDRFDGQETGYGAYFEGASTEIPDGVSLDAWVDEYVSPGGCEVPRSQQAEITIDGQLGRVAACADQIEATVAAGGRLYLFILSSSRSDARAWFDAWVTTIDLTPETATVP
jgi:hypothetical protein